MWYPKRHKALLLLLLVLSAFLFLLMKCVIIYRHLVVLLILLITSSVYLHLFSRSQEKHWKYFLHGGNLRLIYVFCPTFFLKPFKKIIRKIREISVWVRDFNFAKVKTLDGSKVPPVAGRKVTIWSILRLQVLKGVKHDVLGRLFSKIFI